MADVYAACGGKALFVLLKCLCTAWVECRDGRGDVMEGETCPHTEVLGFTLLRIRIVSAL